MKYCQLLQVSHVSYGNELRQYRSENKTIFSFVWNVVSLKLHS